MTKTAPRYGRRPDAVLSLDLDNLWCYQRSFGIESWRDYPSFLHIAVPRILAFLDRLDLRLTVFMIGRDASVSANHPLLAAISGRGHEIGNHSHDHELTCHLEPRETIEAEIVRAEDAIGAATGRKPRGFRGPAFGLSRTLLEVLAARGYDYDASCCPNSLGLLARLYHRNQASRLGGEAKLRDWLYGQFRDIGQPLNPYCWFLDGGSLVEIPVTTLPLLRLPFHGTYLNYLADYSPGLALGYFRSALWLCRLRGVTPSFLLHATDFLGSDDSIELGYMPGMKRSAEEKATFMTNVLEVYARCYNVRPLGAFVDDLKAEQNLPRLVPAFGS